MQTIPLLSGAANAHQIFSVQLGNNFLQFRLNYITRSEADANFAAWTMDISQEGVLLVAGLALVPGANILQNANLDIGAMYFVGDQPTLDNLGSANSLVWSDV